MPGLSSSCGACKFLRRRCTSECVFAPYFCYEQAASHFAAVHKVFGASNVSKKLLHLPEHCRSDAAVTMSYEALARMEDPTYGCVAHIFALQRQVASLKEEIEIIGSQMGILGVDVASCAAYYETTEPYFAIESGITGNSSDQQNLPTLHSRKSSLNQACLGLNELHYPGTEDENSQLRFNSNMLERPLDELNQDNYLLNELNLDYYLFDELKQDYHLHSPWMKSAAP